MSLTNYLELQSFLNIPTIFKNSSCTIYPLTVSEVATIGYTKYSYLLGLLITSKSALEAEGEEVDSVLEYLLQCCKADTKFAQDVKDAFLLFTREKVMLSYKHNTIIIGDFTQKKTIGIEDFDMFQKILRIQNGIEEAEEPPENESPHQKKFRLKREAREAAKRKQQAKNGENLDFSDIVSSLCAFGVGINPLNVGELTVGAVWTLFSKLGAKSQFEGNFQSILAGGKPSDFPLKSWYRIDKNTNK